MNFIDYTHLILDISDELEAELLKSLKSENLPKKYLLHDEGEICRRIYFVEKGLGRAFYYNADGKDITDWFATEGTFLTAVDSFFQQKPSRYFLELLEDSTLHSLTFQQVEEILRKFPEMERFGRLMIQQVFEKTVNRLMYLQFQTAQERYQSFVETYPTLLNRTSLGHIASFLGITQETLSRIRAK